MSVKIQVYIILGNGHLHHPNTLIVDWITHDWVRHLGMNQYFSFKEGNLTIGEAGLYLIYAQVRKALFTYIIHLDGSSLIYKRMSHHFVNAVTTLFSQGKEKANIGQCDFLPSSILFFTYFRSLLINGFQSCIMNLATLQ